MGFEFIALLLVAFYLFAIAYGLYVIVVGKVEFRRGRIVRGMKARLLGVLLIVVIVGFICMMAHFAPDD